VGKLRTFSEVSGQPSLGSEVRQTDRQVDFGHAQLINIIYTPFSMRSKKDATLNTDQVLCIKIEKN
jgi:hypothetical protein